VILLMANTMPPSRTFINITNAPSDDKDIRRVHIRRTVMLNYHRRRKQRQPAQRQSASITIPQAVTPTTHLGQQLLQPRSWPHTEDKLTSRRLLRFLHGQVRKAAEGVRYASFIHRQSSHAKPLAACQHILRSSAGQWQWALVYQHQEDIYTQCSTTYTKWELLSAAQAITLYLLLRLKTGANPAAFAGADVALLFTLQVHPSTLTSTAYELT
jgi:hypothetical protein